MAEVGVLRPDARVELLNGRIIDISPSTPLHAGLVRRLNDVYSALVSDRWLVGVQSPLRLDDYSEPEPDLLLLKRAPDFYKNQHPRPADVFLLIEVSDSTLDYDREEKVPAYGRAGVSEVWIVDLIHTRIEVYREPHFGGYTSRTVYAPGDALAPQAFPDAVLQVAELFSR